MLFDVLVVTTSILVMGALVAYVDEATEYACKKGWL